MALPTTTPRLNDLEQRALQAGTKNLIINGNFDFWQRGTSITIPSNTYLADRFNVDKGTAPGTNTYLRSTNIPTLAQSGFSSTYSLQITNGSGSYSIPSTDTYSINYMVEGYDYAEIHGKSFRLQFMVMSSVAGTYSICFKNSASDRSYVATYTISSGEINTWVKKSIDVIGDSTGTWLFDNNIGLRIMWILSTGTTRQTSTLNQWQSGNFHGTTSQVHWANTSGAIFRLSQVQLIPGAFDSSIAIPFKRAGRTIQDELAMCQRYFEKSNRLTDTPGSTTTLFFQASNFNTSQPSTIKFAVAKRVNSSMTFWDSSGTINRVSDNSGSVTLSTIELTEFSFKPNYNGGGSSFIQYNWQADAEL